MCQSTVSVFDKYLSAVASGRQEKKAQVDKVKQTLDIVSTNRLGHYTVAPLARVNYLFLLGFVTSAIVFLRNRTFDNIPVAGFPQLYFVYMTPPYGLSTIANSKLAFEASSTAAGMSWGFGEGRVTTSTIRCGLD